MEGAVKFKSRSSSRQIKSMLRVDFRRMLKSKLFYILIALALVIPIVMTVMLTMMDGTVSVDPQTGKESIINGPDSVWQSIGTLPTDDMAAAMGGMDVMAMCNINMMFMLVSVFVCLFIYDDFRSGYAKNLFTVRVKRGEYVISKTVSGFVCGGLMLIAYFVGAILGGMISGLSLALPGFTVLNLVMCILSKIALMLVFVPIFVIISIASKQKAWLAICGSLGGGMLLFMMVGMITPLNSTIIHLFMCLAGGAMFSFGLGIGSKAILKKTSLV